MSAKQKWSNSSTSSSSGSKTAPSDPLFYDNFCHFPGQSHLTKVQPEVNFHGFTNFVYLVLLISVGRLVLENVVHYGFKANPIRWLVYVFEDPFSRPTFILLLLLQVFVVLSLVLERLYVWYLLSNNRLVTHNRQDSDSDPGKIDDNRHWMDKMDFQFTMSDTEEFYFQLLYLGLLALMLSLPLMVALFFEFNPYLLGFISFTYSAFALKLYSYHQVNSWWRTRTVYGIPMRTMLKDKYYNKDLEKYFGDVLELDNGDQNGDQLLQYPQNLTLANICYFEMAPTLCYQLNYPRTKSINFIFLLRCTLEFILLVEVLCVLSQQWVMIPLSSKRVPLEQFTVAEFILRWTKLSLGTISLWLVCFYVLFQSWCNLVAELLHFADRRFYKDWWNAETISEFWRKWNSPVHNWCVRHVYKPLRYKGLSDMQATMMVFFISGLFHEYVVSVPLKILNLHFLFAMTIQGALDLFVPLVRASGTLGNGWVWSTLILGQSVGIIFYYDSIISST